MACHCAAGWICETHPDQPWPHGDCAGPGMPCETPGCPWWQGPKPAALDTSDWTDVVSVEDDLNDIFQHRAVDHPGTRPCPHCGKPIDMPKTIPYAVIDGVAGGPESVSLDCPHCGKEAEFPLDL